MWKYDNNMLAKGFSTPPPTRRPRPVMPMSERSKSSTANDDYLFHIIHKVPAGDSPYVRAKHVQLIDKDPSRAVSLFWAAINAGDRVDSALKDMSIVMKQLDRSDEAIEAIKSLRHLCPHDSQESLDNVLIELYKKSGRIEEEIEMLQQKLNQIENGVALGGRKTKTARSQGRKVQITVEQEISRILGNLAWAYMQQNNYKAAEENYRKALSLGPDKNKQCNLAICLMHMNRIAEARTLIQAVRTSSGNRQMHESYANSFERAVQMLNELESHSSPNPIVEKEGNQNEIRKSSTLPINRNSEVVSGCIDGGQQHNGSAFPFSRRWTDGHEDKAVQFNQHHRKDNFFWRGNRSPRFMPFRPRSNFQSPHQTTSVDRRKKDTRDENSGERMSPFAAWKHTYSSPSTSGRDENVLLTQPRSSWGPNGDHQRRKFLGDGVVCRSSRKLSFEPPETTENKQHQAAQDVNGDFLPPSSPVNGYWKTSCSIDSYAQMKDQAENSDKQNWKEDSFKGGDKQKSASVVPPLVVDNAETFESSANQQQDQSSGFNTLDSEKLETTSEECFRKNSPGVSDGLLQPAIQNSQSTCDYRKKSWADMAEEEEQELVSESSLAEFYEGWSGEEEFNDENLNGNIISKGPKPQRQITNLGWKLGSLHLKDEYRTPGAGDSSKNLGVQRSLCFNQLQKPESTNYFSSSPLAKKALDFDGCNTVKANGRDSMSRGIKKIRTRNRLQVFQGITLHSESP